MAVTTNIYANMLATQYKGRMDAERLRRIVEAKTLSDAFKMLADYGYAYTDGLTVDGFIAKETDRLVAFVEENAPSENVKNALLARFVYNNVKLAYKSRFHEMPSDGYYTVGFDADKIAKGDYSDADKYMREALETLDEQKVSDPKSIDIALTRAMYAYVLACKKRRIVEYFRAEIDMKNILTAARMRRLGTDDDEFLDGGRIKQAALRESVTDKSFAEAFERTPFEEYAANIEENGFAELWKAERDTDDWLLCMTEKDVANYSSFDPFLNYYTETLIELKTVKTALVCVKTDSRKTFYERVRFD